MAAESITCPKCGMTSYHPEDIKNRYCGNCHQFHDYMLMRPLFLTPENKDKAATVVEFAERPENWYIVGKVDWVPGDRAKFTTVIDTYRCVYTHTVSGGRHYRHLSISVPRRGASPHPISVFTLASFFGFTGASMVDEAATEPGEDWMMQFSEQESCILVIQERAPEG